MAHDIATTILALAKKQVKEEEEIKKQKNEDKFWYAVKNRRNTFDIVLIQTRLDTDYREMYFECASDGLDFYIIVNEKYRLRILADKAGFFSVIDSCVYFKCMNMNEINEIVDGYELFWRIDETDNNNTIEKRPKLGLRGYDLLEQYANFFVKEIDNIKKMKASIPPSSSYSYYP